MLEGCLDQILVVKHESFDALIDPERRISAERSPAVFVPFFNGSRDSVNRLLPQVLVREHEILHSASADVFLISIFHLEMDETKIVADEVGANFEELLASLNQFDFLFVK